MLLVNIDLYCKGSVHVFTGSNHNTGVQPQLSF